MFFSACGGVAFAQSESPDAQRESRAGVVRFQEITPELRDAVERGIARLARDQTSKSGAWPCRPVSYKMSVTALAGLALLAHGDTPNSGPYAKNVERAIKFVLDNQKTEGNYAGLFFDRPEGHPDDRPMHGHGFALLFLAEAYGNTRDPKLRQETHEGIALGCRLVERTISRDGGWYYHPGQNRDEGSVTITQIQALRSAHNSGVLVNKNTIDRAVNYIKASQMEDGGVRYTLNWGKSSAALTAAGVSVLQSAGEYHGDAVEKGYAYLRQHLTTDRDKQPFFYYTHLYAVQAMYQRGGPEWASYFPRIRRELLDQRRGKDYWDSPFGDSYGTAISLLILQVPNRYLPVFQR
jgi:hypothetical protein